MPRVPPRLRRLAAEQARSRRPAESAALRAARTRGLLARAAALAAWDAAADPAAVVVAIGLALAPLAADLAGAMASAHAAAVAHVRAVLPAPVPPVAGRPLALARRPAGLPAVVARYLPVATRAVTDAAAAAARAVAAAAGKAVAAGRDVAWAIRRAFGSAGVTVVGAAGNVLATLAGTLAGRAYSDGMREAVGRAGAAIWGYAYVTERDDRVRPAHRAMDGVRRPAGDPVWLRWTPPCGWNCRCSLVPLAAGDPLAEPTNVPNVSPDAGF
jgi:SPP1 gp7 family putative phage head morphogenesis protein